MKKFFTLFALLVLSISAQAQIYVPGERVSTLEENTQYFIFNTTYTPGNSYDKRWGFVYYDGEVKTYAGAVPEEFTTPDQNYLFTLSNNGDDTWTLFNVGQMTEVGSYYTFTPWMDADSSIKGNAQVRNDDGTFTENENISEDNKVWVISSGEGERPYWNGNNWTSVGANCFAFWSNAHPYAIYTVIEKNTVTVYYNLYDPYGSLIRTDEVEQLPNSAVVIPNTLKEGCGFSPLGYDFVASQETIGDSPIEIDVNITLKEGIVTDIADLSNNKAYMLTTQRGSLGTNNTQMVSTNGTSYEASDFAIINYEDNYYLWSIADDKWVSSNTQPTLTNDLSEVTPLVFDQNDENENPLDLPLYFIGMGENGMNIAGGYGTGIVVNSWVQRDPGNQYVIKENGEFDPTNAITALDVYFHPSYTITYVVKDENGAELLRSEPVGTTQGTNITTLPAGYQKTLFYDYSTVDVTISEISTVIEFTATQKADAPFKFTADTSAPIWYTLKMKDQVYLTYEEGGNPNISMLNYLEEDETTQWAFIGNPYVGFKIVNNAAGTNLVLSSYSAADDGNTGGDTYAELDEEGMRDYSVWTIERSASFTNGFFIRNPENHALNLRNGNLAYWTGGADSGSTFVATKVLSNDEKLDEAQHLLDELTAGANDVVIGYPTADALAQFKTELGNIKDQYTMGVIGEDDLATMLNAAIEEVTSIANTVYTPRTDVYYTITNARGSVVYDPAHAEETDGEGHEFLWWTNSLNKDDVNHQWGFYEKDGKYYLYNVGKQLFASVTKSNPESGKAFFSGGCWAFRKTPSPMMFDAGDEEWVPTPNVRIQGTISETNEYDETYDNAYTMSISTSYTGPVITYYGVNDGGVPMTFALATSTQDDDVTAAIEALLNDDGIETIDNGQQNIGNGAVYNLQGQKVTKATKGVFIVNGKKVVVK